MTEPKRSKRLPAAERRKQLLQTASKLFAEQGYARTTTAQLAQQAGVTEPIIYRHFASKRDLFVALIEETGNTTLKIWKESLENASDPAERLEILLRQNPMIALGDEEAIAYRVIIQSITEVDDSEIHKAVNAPSPTRKNTGPRADPAARLRRGHRRTPVPGAASRPRSDGARC